MDACIGAFIFTQVSKIQWSKTWQFFEPFIWVAMLYILWRPDSPHAYKDYMMLPFGGLFVIMLTKSESLSQKIFSTAPFKFLGKYSLSIFLFHAPILMILQFLNVFQHNKGIMVLIDKILVLVVVVILVIIFEKMYFALREKFNLKIG
jgi:peptidoglycan/LPS O-acetylase OafA/YrhL